MTFDFAIMEGAGPFPLGAQPSTAGEAKSPSQIRLVGALRAWLAWFEPIAGEISCWTLTCIWLVEPVRECRLMTPQKDHKYIVSEKWTTCTGGDVSCPDRTVAVTAGAEVAGELPLPLLESSRWTLDTALLLAVVVRAWRASD